METPEEQQDIETLENEFPLKATGAFRAAYLAALKAGNSVLVAIDGHLVRVSPDGSRETIRRIPKPRIIAPGTKFKIGRPAQSVD